MVFSSICSERSWASVARAAVVCLVLLFGLSLLNTRVLAQSVAREGQTALPAIAQGDGSGTATLVPEVPASAPGTSDAPAGVQKTQTLSGTVKAGNTPIPGATVSATNPETGQKVVGWTSPDGSFRLVVPAQGEYVVRAQMSAFATAVAHVNVATGQNAHADLQLVLLSKAQSAGANQRASMASAARGFQALSVMQSEMAGNGGNGSNGNDSVAPQGMPVPGIPPTISTESVAVSGSQNSGFANMSSEEMRSRFGDYRQQGGIPSAASSGGGGFGGGGGGFGGPGGPGGGGPIRIPGGRGFNFNQPHGFLYYQADDAALDAAPYALRGVPTAKPGYLQQRIGGGMGGPLIIPKIYNGASKTFFFVHFNLNLGSQPYSAFSTVPTALERGGDFSQTLLNGQPVQIYNPATGLAFTNNIIPSSMVNSAAKGLLSYIPLPNLPGTTQNFQYITTAQNTSDDVNFRLNQALGGTTVGPQRGGPGGRNRGPQNNLSFGFHWHQSNQTLTSAYPSVGGHSNVTSYDIPIGWTRSVGKLINNLRFDYNRNEIQTTNLYAFNTDITGQLGITGVSTNPFNWGLPNLAFTHYGGIQDTNPVLNRNQTFTISDSLIYSRGKHTWRWGGDFRRLQVNTETASNPRGTFVFTGVNTAQFVNGVPVAGTGYDFADFLLGYAQQTSVQYGTSIYGYHFRGNSWDAYAQDEWRVNGNLTLNLGLRYEYVSPYSEINNSIVNLNTAPNFSAVAPVFPNGAGAVTGQNYPVTLVNPDRNNFAPRIGFAWKVAKNTVVRGGYGISYNTAAYQNVAQNLAFQPPFSVAQTNVESNSNILTLQNGFPTPPPGTITNTYGINLNYRLGYVQIWNLDVQQEITPTLLVNLDYTGTKGTNLDILEAPNRTPTGVLYPTVPVFYWQNSVGASNANAGSLRVRKRLSHGVSLGGTYTWSKSLDDASTIGSGIGIVGPNGQITGQTSVAQNPNDLQAEYGLSSFDQRQRFTGDWLWELPFGPDKPWLNQPGVARAIFGHWQMSGDWTIASGFPFTPRFLGTVTTVNSGVNGTLRPNVTGVPISLSNPTIEEWFNTSAFVQPPVGQYGNARRNSIEGPGQLLFDMGLTRVIPLKESRNLELRMAAANVFNRPQFTTIDTVVNSPTFGRVIGVGSMRTVQLIARFRF